MNLQSILSLIVLIVILYVAFRVGAFLIKVLLGLAAIGLVIWLVMQLFNSSS